MTGRFSAVLDDLPIERLRAEIAAKLGFDEADTDHLVTTYLREAEAGYDMIAPEIAARRPRRILEVGAGLGLVSAALRRDGWDVMALEPESGRFDFFAVATEAFADALGDAAAPLLRMPAEALDPEEHGTFDFIFSVNVMEHIPALSDAVRAMSSVLAPGGVMVHTCPNYAVPYEPHFSIPLVPLFPQMTRHVLRRRIAADEGLWETFNFISAGRVRREARANGLSASFAPGLMAEYIGRFGTDPVFKARHAQSAVGKGIALMHRLGVVNLLRRWPASLATPMRFTLEKSQTRVPERMA